MFAALRAVTQLTAPRSRPKVRKAPGGNTMITQSGQDRGQDRDPKQGACAQEFPDGGNARQGQAESQALADGVGSGGERPLFGGHHLAAADDDAVDDNQGDIGPQGFAHLVDIGGQETGRQW